MKEVAIKFEEAQKSFEEIMTREIHKSIDDECNASDIAGMISIRSYLATLGNLVLSISKDIEELNRKIDDLSNRDTAQ